MRRNFKSSTRYTENGCSFLNFVRFICQCGLISFIIFTIAGYFIFYYDKPPSSDIIMANRVKQNENWNNKAYNFLSEKSINNEDSYYKPIIEDIKYHDLQTSKENDHLEIRNNNIGIHENNIHISKEIDNNIIAEISNKKYRPINTVDIGESVNSEIWDNYIKDMGYVGVGKVYQACDNIKQIGIVILMKDEINDGIKIRTMINTTFDTPIFKATFHLKSFYGGRLLYTNKWDLCERLKIQLIKNDTEKIQTNVDSELTCPIDKGFHHFIRDAHIPKLLPAGTFTTRAWVIDDNTKRTICCSKSTIIL